jgi:spore coat protein A
LKTGGGLGAASVIPLSATSVTAQVEELTSPDSILNAGWQEIQIGNAKPAVMESTGSRKGAPYYHIEMAPGTHEHHPDIPDTPIWGYKGPNDDEGKYPGKTIEATQNQRLKVEFSNDPLPETHLLTDSVDTAVHGTKPEDYEDRYPDWVSQFEAFGGTFAFPEVRTVTHAHGVHVESASDGLPEQWQSPGGIEGPQFQKAVYDYPNRQSPATLWYHDHALGITRLNVYAGLAGFYLIRGRSDRRLGLPSGDQEIPLLFQDRMFHENGRYKYPAEFAPEFAGDVSVVNGKAWPTFVVQPRQYRFRLLNGSNGRFFDISLENENDGEVPTIYQIGTDLGFLQDVVPIGSGQDTTSLLLGPAERADVIVDFSEYAGDTLTVKNDAGFPFVSPDADNNDGGGLPELAQFRVADTDPETPVVDPTTLKLPGPETFREEATKTTRQMSLETTTLNGLDTHLLGEEGGRAGGEHWNDPVLTKPQIGTTEVWEITNNTPDSHPIHLHLVDFQVIGRGPDGTEPPEPTERGNKDTVNVYGGETVRIISRFGEFSGRYVWHCHILEHEDQEMMRPYEVIQGNSS